MEELPAGSALFFADCQYGLGAYIRRSASIIVCNPFLSKVVLNVFGAGVVSVNFVFLMQGVNL